jgi:acyl-coenzyme A synthetase/AMP-(fatty) acid ligase
LDLARSLSSRQIVVEELSDESSPCEEKIHVTADDTSIVLFTSGSTGTPKGVHHNHQHLREVIMGTVGYFNLTEDDVILLTNTICFDVHMLQIYTPLMVGATLVISKQDGHLDGDYIASQILNHSVTGLIFTVPSLAREYMRSSLFKEPYHLMKHWGMGGDKVTHDIAAQMQTVFPSIKGPVNSYGPTEANVVTQYRFPIDPEMSLIGVPDDNVHCCVVDSDLNLLPWGEAGELLISGPRIALGYYKSPDLTREKFVRNPAFDLLVDIVPESMQDRFKVSYRTGDLVKFRNCGNLECLGRIDRQVKINGVRIEVEEVEASLKGADGVEDAVVCLVKNRQGSNVLAGYVRPENVDIGAAMARCMETLLSSMVPSIIVPLKAFPLLPNGKIDMNSLPEPEWPNLGDSGKWYIEPKNDLERTIQRVWMEVLNIDKPISMDDDFFMIGGQSMTGIRAMAILRSENVGHVSLKLLFQNPTIRDVANAIQSDENHPSKTIRSVTFKRVPSKALKQTSSLKTSLRRLSFRRETIKSKIGGDILGSLANLSPESINISSYYQGNLPKTRMPYSLYLVLQVVTNSFIKCLHAFFLAAYILCCVMLKSVVGSGFIVFMAPLLFFLFVNIGLIVAMIIGKKVLFYSGLQPGVYPLYGTMYVKWLCGSMLQKEGFKHNFWFLRRTEILVRIFRAMGGRIRSNVILDSCELLEPGLINMQGKSSVGEAAIITPAFIVPEGCFGEDPYLIFSPVYIGTGCDVGIAASIHGGGKLSSNHSL